MANHEQEEQRVWYEVMTDMTTQMMFVSGETAEPSPETTTIIEEIVREQVVEMVGNKKTNLFISSKVSSTLNQECFSTPSQKRLLS